MVDNEIKAPLYARHDGNGTGGAPGRPPRTILFMIIAVVVLGLLATLFIAYDKVVRPAMIGKFLAAMRPPPAPVATAVAVAETVPQLLPAVGSLQAVHQVTVTPEVGGTVVKLLFESGASVTAGQPLVQINDRPQQGDLANYRAQAHVAALDQARYRTLVARQAASQQQVDQAQATLEQANANIAKTEAQIAQLLVRAPFSGVLGVRQIDLGQYVKSGDPIVTLTDLDHLYANFTVAEGDRGRVAVGQTVRLTVSAYPNRVFEGRITAIDPQVSVDTRTVKLQATLGNPDHALQPGMFANVTVMLPPAPDQVVLPETAVDYSLYGNSVFVVREAATPDGKTALHVERLSVSTGDRVNGRVILLAGIKPGDRVVVAGQNKLHNGDAVVLSDQGAPPSPTVIPRP